MNRRGPNLLHVLGGGRWQEPTVRAAKSLGMRVLVTDMYEQRPCYALADVHEVIDITDLEATLDCARRHRVDGIICDTTDVGVPTAAYVAEKLALPGIGYQTALNFTDKLRMRRITRDAGVSTVRFMAVRSEAQMPEAAEMLGLPFMIKPADNQSSRGVHRIDDPAMFSACFRDAIGFSRARTLVAEEYLPGVEVTVEGICIGGRYHTMGISDKDHFQHRPEVANRLTYPPDFDSATSSAIRRFNERVVGALGMRNGVTHAEYKVDGGEVQLVEIAARGGGSFVYSDIAPYLSGIDAPRAYIQYLTGGWPGVRPHGQPRAAHLEFFDFPPGRVRTIHGVRDAGALEGVHTLLLEFGVGDVLRPPDDDRSRPAIMVVFGRTRADVLARAQRVKSLVRVEIE